MNKAKTIERTVAKGNWNILDGKGIYLSNKLEGGCPNLKYDIPRHLNKLSNKNMPNSVEQP